jgi:probable addiction module antidote protein
MEKTVTFAEYDTADYIKTKEDVLAFLDAALEENDPEFLLSAIGDIVRSKGMAMLSKDLNLDHKGRRIKPQGTESPFSAKGKAESALGTA